jgi:hypothetical protein
MQFRIIGIGSKNAAGHRRLDHHLSLGVIIIRNENTHFQFQRIAKFSPEVYIPTINQVSGAKARRGRI